MVFRFSTKPETESSQRQQAVAKKWRTLTLRPDHDLALLSRSILFYCSLAYLALLLVPVSFNPININSGTDYGWQYALNSFWERGVIFGRDVVFTYGPLGFIVAPEAVGTNLFVGNVFRLAIWGLLLFELAGLWRSGNHLPAAILTVSAILTNGLYSFLWEYSIVLVIVVLLVRLFDDPFRNFTLALLGLLSGILFLIKFSGFLLAAPAVILFALHRLAKSRETSLKDLTILILCIFSGPVLYLLYNPSLVDLTRYIRGALSLSSGYGVAMAIAMPYREMIYVLELSLILVVLVANFLHKRTLPIPAAAIAIVMAWIAFKHGMVRCDGAHAAIFFLFSVVVFGFVVSIAKLNFRTAIPVLALFLVYSGLALEAEGATIGAWRASWWAPATGLSRLRPLLNSEKAVKDFGTPAGHSSDLSHESAADARGKRVLVLPTELAYSAFYHFDLVPFFAMQGYSAYTPFLDRTSAEHIERNAPPIDLVLFDWTSVDGRHPILDLPATWTVLFERFMIQRSGAASLLLTHRKQPLKLNYSTIGQSEWMPDNWIAVPKNPAPVAATLDLSLTPSGLVRTSLYELPYAFLEVRTLAGRIAKFRIVPSLLSSPFLVSALPLEAEQLVDLWERNLVRDPITELRLSGDGLRYLHHASIKFSTVSGVNIMFSTQPVSGR